MDRFADRASRHRFWSNPFRQLLSVLAYTLIEGLRRLALRRTVLATASPNRIRPPDLAANRSRGAAPYSPYPSPAQQHLPAPGVVPHGRRSAWKHLLTVAECCPGTLTN